jgi:hypothetical protein
MRRHKTLNQDVARLPSYGYCLYLLIKNFRKRAEAEIFGWFIALLGYDFRLL